MMRLILALLLLLPSLSASAHTLAPSLLQITPADDAKSGRYEVLWRVDVLTPQMTPRWPEDCQTGPPSITRDKRQLNYRYLLQCSNDLRSGQLRIDGLDQAASAVLLRRLDASATTEQLIYPTNPIYNFTADPQNNSIWLRYLLLGIEHILAGPDHLLLVLGLFWLGRNARQILTLSLCFTLGHSLTLVLASLRWISLPQAWVELAIAFTLLWLAMQMGPRRHHAGAHQSLVFSAFGLIHGLGFAGALKSIGLDSGQLLASLFSFNLGIELGQLIFLLGMAALLRLSQRAGHAWVASLRGLSRYVIGSLACYWCLDRILLLLN